VQQEIVEVDADSLTDEQLHHAMYGAGELRWKLQSHQLADYDAFDEWNVERQTREHLRWVAEIGALYDNLWVDECGRRYGKTVKWLICDVREGIRRPECRGLIATAKQKNIGGIIVPLTKMLFKDAPKGYFPEYRGTRGADHECLYIPATGSIIKLVGLDLHPDATRGQFLDFCHISEAAFVKGLHELITAVINPQFRYRPWSWLALETSTSKTVDCDFNDHFRKDAKLRGTYRMRTIRDNTNLTDEEIATEERRSGGKDSHICRRELYCEEVRDPELMVIPEYDETRHVMEPERPEHAMAIVAMDPGMRDLFALLWGYWDAKRAKLVIERDWCARNTSTAQVAEVIRSVELDLYAEAADLLYLPARGSLDEVNPFPNPSVGRVWMKLHPQALAESLDSTVRQLVGVGLARDEFGNIITFKGHVVVEAGPRAGYLIFSASKQSYAAYAQTDEEFRNSRDAEGLEMAPKQHSFGINKPSGLCYWDGKQFMSNPSIRVSDTDARLIGDLTTDYNISVGNTYKDDKEAALFALRNAFRDDKIEIHSRCVNLQAHVRAARWNDNRTDYERTEALGHNDLLDALVYMWRMVQPLRGIDPYPPEILESAGKNVVHLPWVPKPEYVKELDRRMQLSRSGGRPAGRIKGWNE
jgi:hypothetical protein